jgi:hypothetical protein
MDALMMAVWRRGKADALLHHSDQGSQGGINRSSQHPDLGGVDDDRKTEVGALDATQIILARSAASLAA